MAWTTWWTTWCATKVAAPGFSRLVIISIKSFITSSFKGKEWKLFLGTHQHRTFLSRNMVLRWETPRSQPSLQPQWRLAWCRKLCSHQQQLHQNPGSWTWQDEAKLQKYLRTMLWKCHGRDKWVNLLERRLLLSEMDIYCVSSRLYVGPSQFWLIKRRKMFGKLDKVCPKNVEYFEQRPAGDSSSRFKARSSEIDSGSSQHVPILRSKHQGKVGSNWTENIWVKNIWMKNISHWDLWCRLLAECSHQFWRCVDQGNHLLLQWLEDLWSEFSESRACTHRPWFHYLNKIYLGTML